VENSKFQFHMCFGDKIQDIKILNIESFSFQEAVREAYARLSYMKSNTGKNWKILKVIDSTYWELLDE